MCVSTVTVFGNKLLSFFVSRLVYSLFAVSVAGVCVYSHIRTTFVLATETGFTWLTCKVVALHFCSVLSGFETHIFHTHTTKIYVHISNHCFHLWFGYGTDSDIDYGRRDRLLWLICWYISFLRGQMRLCYFSLFHLYYFFFSVFPVFVVGKYCKSMFHLHYFLYFFVGHLSTELFPRVF